MVYAATLALSAARGEPARAASGGTPTAPQIRRTSTGLIDMGIKAAIAALLARIFDIDSLVVLGLMLLVAVDFGTGVWRAWRRGGAEAITSKGLRRTFEKVAIYSAWILLALAIGNLCGNDAHLPAVGRSIALSLPSIAVACVMVLEGASILENITGRPFGVVVRAMTEPIKELLRAKRQLEDASGIDSGDDAPDQ